MNSEAEKCGEITGVGMCMSVYSGVRQWLIGESGRMLRHMWCGTLDWMASEERRVQGGIEVVEDSGEKMASPIVSRRGEREDGGRVREHMWVALEKTYY